MTFMYLRVPDGGVCRSTPRVMLVDDHDSLRDRLREALAEHGIEVVAEADGGALATVLAPHVGPSVILMDIRMPGQDGVETVEQLRLLGVEAPVIILTGHPDPRVTQAARRAGASEVMVKGTPVETIAAAVRREWSATATLWWAGNPAV